MMEQIDTLPAHIFQPRWEWEKMEHPYTCYTEVTGQRCPVSSPNTVGCPLTRTLNSAKKVYLMQMVEFIPLKLSGSFWEVCYQLRALALQFWSQAQKRCYHKEIGIQALPGKPSPLPTIFLWLGINLPATQRCSQGWFRTAGLQVWRRNAIVSTFSSLCHTQRLRSSFYFPLVPFSSPITFLTAMTSFNDNLAQARVIRKEGSSTEKMSPQEGAAGKPA